MSLIDELLIDFEDMGNDHEVSTNSSSIEKIEPMVTDDIFQMNHCLTKSNISSVAKLKDSILFQEIMKKIDFYSKHQRISSIENQGLIEDDPEYSLIVDANNLIVQIDNEINIIHNFVKNIYKKKFSELEQLVQLPLDYLKTVQELRNNIDRAKSNENLRHFLSQATIMILCVTASVTRGENLTNEELNSLTEACQMGINLNENKQTILSYVESRMKFIAPNLSIIVDSSTAAKLIGMANGLKNLSKMPACHILLLGAQQKAFQGFSSLTTQPHTGAIFYSKIVQNCPPDFRIRLARLVACKVTLAARIDSFHESPKGEQGLFLLNEIKKRLDKLQEPPPVKAIKPLPKPIESGGKKRGGRRHRKMKERLQMTELRKQENRMNFGEIGEDIDQTAMGYSLGTINSSGSGKIRKTEIDQKSKAKVSQTLQKDLKRQMIVSGVSTSVNYRNQINGTASSVAFTPYQGLQIINPNAMEKKEIDSESQKYFSNTSGFSKIGSSVIPKTT